MNHPCRNEWCPSKVAFPGMACGPCARSAERTARLMGRVEDKVRARVRKAAEEELCK